MSEPLWSNQRIRDRYHALVPSEANMGEMEYWNVLRDVGERVSYELRNDYEAQLSNQYQRIERFVELVNQLEAQLAQTWQPLPDGLYLDDALAIAYNGKDIGLKIDDVYANDDWASNYEWLSDCEIRDYRAKDQELRLCRLVTQEPTL